MRHITFAMATLPLLFACRATTIASVPLHLTSRADFPAGERRIVWGRAVTSFQIAGAFIDLTDSIGGVLQSKPHTTWTLCNNAIPQETGPLPSWATDDLMCRSTIAVQFTLTDDGTATLRVNRGVTGVVHANESLFTDEDLKALQGECDEWLKFIVGKSPNAPEPLRPAPAETLKI